MHGGATGIEGDDYDRNIKGALHPENQPPAGQADRGRAESEAETPGGPEDVPNRPRRDAVPEVSGEADHKDAAEAKQVNLAEQQKKLWAKEKKLIDRLNEVLATVPAFVKTQVKKHKKSTVDAVRYMKETEATFKAGVERNPAGAAIIFETSLDTMETRFKLGANSDDLTNRVDDLVRQVKKYNTYAYQSHEARKHVREPKAVQLFETTLRKDADEFAETAKRILHVKDIKIREATQLAKERMQQAV